MISAVGLGYNGSREGAQVVLVPTAVVIIEATDSHMLGHPNECVHVKTGDTRSPCRIMGPAVGLYSQLLQIPAEFGLALATRQV